MRYSRQESVAEIGKNGQEKIRAGRVLIVGCGALGSMVAMQLAGAGIGKIGIVDYDNIDISNLQRQFFFKTEEAGKSKTHILGQRIGDLNPEVEVKIYSGLLTKVKCEEIIDDYDFIIDATDNPESKQMIGSVSLIHEKPCCIGGVRDFGGQVITFLPGEERLEGYFGTANSEGVLPCALGGVIGPAAALCASIQASEVIKYFTGAGKLLSGKLLTFDLQKDDFHIFEIS